MFYFKGQKMEQTLPADAKLGHGRSLKQKNPDSSGRKARSMGN